MVRMLLALPIVVLLVQSAQAAEQEVPSEQARLEQSLELIATSASIYTEERKCFTCHHQALPVMTLTLAQELGVAIDPQVVADQVTFTEAYFSGRQNSIERGGGVPGGSYTAGYAMITLAAVDEMNPQPATALADYLLMNQGSNGGWNIRSHRPPLEDSDFAATALSLRGLRLFQQKLLPAESIADEVPIAPQLNPIHTVPTRAEAIDQAIVSARRWLQTTKAVKGEDFSMRLLGLHWADADQRTLDLAREALLARQLADGGWAQLDSMQSDAYATGQALVALHQAGGLATDSEAYQRGLAWLRQNWQDDASWKVQTRSKPIQVYFESGFPHEKSQFISIAGSCWSTMALLLAQEPAKNN